MTPARWAVCAAALTLTACGAKPPEPVVLTVAANKPVLAVADTATLVNGNSSVVLTVTLTCVSGYTAFGSVGVSDNAQASDMAQPQGYSGVLRIPCTGQPQELPLTLTSAGTPFRPGPVLVRVGFTLNLCDPGCQWDYLAKTITNVGGVAVPRQAPPPADVAPGEGGP